MGFLKRIFGGGESGRSSTSDSDGFFFYVQCENCGAKVRLRILKQYELNHAGDGFVWHKTIVDNRCFRQIPAVVHFDRQYQVTNAQIEGGKIISAAEYEQQGENI